MTGPTPKTPGQAGSAALTAAASFFLVLAELGVEAAQVLQELGGELVAGSPTAPDGVTCPGSWRPELR